MTALRNDNPLPAGMALPDAVQFKEAMQRYPSGVVIATVRNRAGQPRGFTASSFTSLSLQPALVLLCLGRSAECHADFCAAERFAVNILRPQHEALALRFGMRGGDKFACGSFTAGAYELPVFGDALAQLVCRLHDLRDYGDHSLLVGAVDSVRLGGEGAAMVRYQRRFASVAAEVRDVA